MTCGEREAVADYIGRVEKEWRSGQATEHSYRPMLKELVEALLPRVLVIRRGNGRSACQDGCAHEGAGWLKF